jgi:hypothetical protein
MRCSAGGIALRLQSTRPVAAVAELVGRPKNFQDTEGFSLRIDFALQGNRESASIGSFGSPRRHSSSKASKVIYVRIMKHDAFSKEVLETLKRQGVDARKQQNMEYYVYSPRADYAKLAATKIREGGFTAEVSRDGKRWLIVASKSIVPASADIADHGRFFSQVAAAIDGDFDGWQIGPC